MTMADDSGAGGGREADTLTRRWVGLTEAASLLGCSERTIRRRVTRNEIPARKLQGRTLVGLADDDGGRGQRQGAGGGTLSGSVNAPKTQTDLSVVHAAMGQAVALATGRVDELGHELRSSRAFGRLGWGLAAVLAVGGAVASVSAFYGYRDAEAARKAADTLAAAEAALEADLASERTRADALTGTVAELRVELDRARVERDELVSDVLAQVEGRVRAEGEAEKIAALIADRLVVPIVEHIPDPAARTIFARSVTNP